MNSAGLNPKLWAGEVLGLNPEAPRAELRAEYLRKLADAEFLPPPSWPQAFAALGQGQAANQVQPLAGPLLEAEEEHWRDAVEAFAAEFFLLDSSQRQGRWTQLQEGSSWSRTLSARLRELKRGLAVEPPSASGASPEVLKLAAHLCTLFPLRPRERAERRHEVLERLKATSDEDPDAWRAAAATLRKQHPALVELEPVLVDKLAAWKKRRDAAPLLPRAPAKNGSKGTASSSEQRYEDVPPNARTLPQPVKSTPTPLWPIWIVIVLVLGGLRLFTAGMNSSSTSMRPVPKPMPTYKYPAFDPNSDVGRRLQELEQPADRNAPWVPGGGPLPTIPKQPTTVEDILRQRQLDGPRQPGAGQPPARTTNPSSRGFPESPNPVTPDPSRSLGPPNRFNPGGRPQQDPSIRPGVPSTPGGRGPTLAGWLVFCGLGVHPRRAGADPWSPRSEVVSRSRVPVLGPSDDAHA
jgi:hypothetical protein